MDQKSVNYYTNHFAINFLQNYINKKRKLQIEDFGKYANVDQGHDVIGTRIFPDILWVPKEAVHLFLFPSSRPRGVSRVESKQSRGKLSLCMVRSSSVLKYSSAWRFTFMRDQRLQESKNRTIFNHLTISFI